MKQLLKKNRFVLSIYNEFLYYRNKILCVLNPKWAANIVYKKVFGCSINWKTPKNLIEKISWLEIYSDTSLWTQCADKYRVREYIKAKGCEELLVKLYGVWDNPKAIDFNKLPNKFVIKANNGCGTVKIVKNKQDLDYKQTIKMLESWLKRPYGYASAQLHYLAITPCIIVEELLEQSGEMDCGISESLVDYKVWCINGIPECIMVIFDRKEGHYCRQIYDINWNKMPHIMKKENSKSRYVDVDFSKPKNLHKMLEYAKCLSEPFKEVRVDFYIVDDRVYFGELTFSAGFASFTKEYYEYLGAKVNLKDNL